MRYRPMAPADIRECVDLVSNNPVIGPRYGHLIERLPEVWLSLLECDLSTACVFYGDEGSHAPICFFGITAAVEDGFLCEMKTPPHFWIGPELTRRFIAGKSPVVTGKDFRRANSHGGLNLVCLENCVREGHKADSELQRSIMSTFIELHRGYLWKELIANQPESRGRLAFLLNTGALVWDPFAQSYSGTLRDDPEAIVNNPHVLGVTRELESAGHQEWAGTWVGTLFDYHDPLLGLNRSEQRLLTRALGDATDENLAGLLGISPQTVKNMWVSIYRRVEDHLPELISDPFRSEVAPRSRGREKRRRLLSYLREHPEELRPYSAKLLTKCAAAK